MKHTKGEWELYNPKKQRPTTARGNPSDKRIMVLHPDKVRVIACMNTGYCCPKQGPIPEEERLANAALISAVPELLELAEYVASRAAFNRVGRGVAVAKAEKALRKAGTIP